MFNSTGFGIVFGLQPLNNSELFFHCIGFGSALGFCPCTALKCSLAAIALVLISASGNVKQLALNVSSRLCLPPACRETGRYKHKHAKTHGTGLTVFICISLSCIYHLEYRWEFVPIWERAGPLMSKGFLLKLLSSAMKLYNISS